MDEKKPQIPCGECDRMRGADAVDSLEPGAGSRYRVDHSLLDNQNKNHNYDV